MAKKNIVIVGYPKSGTTWASRLIAELIGCPLIGDWGYEEANSAYADSKDRDSEYHCYKSHHNYLEIYEASTLKIHKIIYIIRDPRDVAISGSHYFNFSFPGLSFLKKQQLLKLDSIFRRLGNKILPIKQKRRQMIQAILHGNEHVNPWLKTSWKSHYSGFMQKKILFVTYENLLLDTAEECNKIMFHLDIEITNDHLKSSIKKQNFTVRKQQVLKQGDPYLKKLVRKGSMGYWKKEFSNKEILQFKNELATSNDFYTF